MLEILGKKIKNWHLWIIKSRDNAVAEVLFPVMTIENTFCGNDDTRTEFAASVAFDKILDARFKKIEENIKNIARALNKLQQSMDIDKVE